MLSEKAWKWFSPIHQDQLSHVSPPGPAASGLGSRSWHQLLLFQPFISLRRREMETGAVSAAAWAGWMWGKTGSKIAADVVTATLLCQVHIASLSAADERGDCSQAVSRIVRLLSNTAFPHSPDPFLLYLSYSHCRLISFLILKLIFFSH